MAKAISFKRHVGILSGPVALWGCRSIDGMSAKLARPLFSIYIWVAFFPHPNVNGKKWSGYVRLRNWHIAIALQTGLTDKEKKTEAKFEEVKQTPKKLLAEQGSDA